MEGASRAGVPAYLATWHLRRWPGWEERRRTQLVAFTELRTPEEVVALVDPATASIG